MVSFFSCASQVTHHVTQITSVEGARCWKNTLIDGEQSDSPPETAEIDLLHLLLQLNPQIICEGANVSLRGQQRFCISAPNRHQVPVSSGSWLQLKLRLTPTGDRCDVPLLFFPDHQMCAFVLSHRVSSQTRCQLACGSTFHYWRQSGVLAGAFQHHNIRTPCHRLEHVAP